jgi:mono/diheme cytochrome c family protein
MKLHWCILCLGLLTRVASAQDLPGDPAAGLELARAWCTPCHVVESGDLHPDDGQADGAPLVVLADDPAVTEMSLRVFFQTPHADMPDLRLTHDQISDLIAYILSLRDGQPPAKGQ